jgi:hypothetical protein
MTVSCISGPRATIGPPTIEAPGIAEGPPDAERDGHGDESSEDSSQHDQPAAANVRRAGA